MAKEQVEKLKPLINSTSAQIFISTSKKIAQSQGLSRHDHCKNVERKLGASVAKKEFNDWK